MAKPGIYESSLRYSRDNKYISGLIVFLVLYLLKAYLLDEDESYKYDLNDGPTSKGFGITRGGTGNLGFHKDHRRGGLPPTERSKYQDQDPSIYDYELDHDEFDTWNGDKNKIVIVLGANIGGGVNNWKGPNEWSIERSSILNKKYYARKHGYDLIIKDMTKAKKYTAEFREGWQKFDIIGEVFQEYNYGDWIWYLDLYSLIMEPEIKLEDLIFKTLNETIKRDLNYFNPNDLELDIPYVNYQEPLNLLLTQDCGGFNLNSFFIKKTAWSITLMDTLFEPVIYLKNLQKWKNGEKNALESYYNNFAWVRSRVGFLPTKSINSLPRGACPDFQYKEEFFYNETSRDFLINMNGCEFNRNCWDEMEYYKQSSKNLHKSWLKRVLHL